MAGSTRAAHKAFLLCNYTLLGAASACIFLTLSLRLAPSACGLLLVFLHSLTAVFAAAGCSGSFTDGGAGRAHAAHTAGAVLTAIQGAAALRRLPRRAAVLRPGGGRRGHPQAHRRARHRHLRARVGRAGARVRAPA